jgi:hypothetical protein
MGQFHERFLHCTEQVVPFVNQILLCQFGAIRLRSMCVDMNLCKKISDD